MTLFLRNNKNESIVDIEIWVKRDAETKRSFVELRSVVCIKPYSEFLLANSAEKEEIIDTFDNISELRGWMWENYFMVKDNTPDELQNVVNEVSDMLREIGKKFGLRFITN